MSQQSHFFPDRLNYGIKSQALWSVNPARKLIIFVHGFGGAAVGTWFDFPKLLPNHPLCAGRDIVFYGYDGLYTQANISAQQLHEFLNDIATDAATVINRSINPFAERDPSFQYDSIRIVAHSLGAVVTRRALLNAIRVGRTWLSRTQMILFAPAHMGANVVALGAEAFSSIPWVGAAISSVGRFRLKPLQDLATGSPTLRLLVDDTQQALQTGNAGYLVAKAVYVGQLEQVVTTDAFCDDPPPVCINGKGHMDVCKPNTRYNLPVQEVLK